MTIELKLFIGLLLAFIGDYVLQNDYLANEKTKRFLPALIHATIYSLPFLAVCWSKWWFVIWITHFFIDRYRLAVYWLKLVNWNWESTNFGFANDKPLFMSIWLMIIVDNILHVVINSISIYFGNL